MENGTVPSSGDDTKLAITIIAVFIAILLVFATMGYFLFRSLEYIELLPDADPLPHSRLAVTESIANLSTEDLAPIEVDLLGNATGHQVLVVRGEDGRVTSFASDDLFAENVTRRTVCQLSEVNATGDRVTLGRLLNGTVALSCEGPGEVQWWALAHPFGNWTSLEAPVEITVTSVPGLVSSDMPFPRHVENWETAWDSMRVGGSDIVVGAYWYQAGCMQGYYHPAVLFRGTGGDWSTMVALDRHRPEGFTQVAGTSLEDMIIVTNLSHAGAWFVYSVTDGAVRAVGEQPPTAGLE